MLNDVKLYVECLISYCLVMKHISCIECKHVLELQFVAKLKYVYEKTDFKLEIYVILQNHYNVILSFYY